MHACRLRSDTFCSGGRTSITGSRIPCPLALAKTKRAIHPLLIRIKRQPSSWGVRNSRLKAMGMVRLTEMGKPGMILSMASPITRVCHLSHPVNVGVVVRADIILQIVRTCLW